MIGEKMSQLRHIVRIHGTDLDGSIKLSYALTRIKGVNINIANAIMKVTKLDPNVRIGTISDEDVQKINDVLKYPTKQEVPYWLLNYRRDLETGENSHIISSDLSLRMKADIDFMKKIKSRKGIRHSLGLKVRGQRTKTTGRTGRVVGVKKKTLIERKRAEESR
jgi:small subunit ribosomal protein S13